MSDYFSFESINILPMLVLSGLALASVATLSFWERYVERRRASLRAANYAMEEFRRCAALLLNDPETPPETRESVLVISEHFEDSQLAKSIMRAAARVRSKQPRLDEEMRKIQARLTEEAAWLEQQRPDLSRAFTKAVMASVACACYRSPETENAFMFMYVNDQDAPCEVAGDLAREQFGRIKLRDRQLAHCS